MDRYRLLEGKQLARTREALVYFQAPRFTTAERDAINEPKQGAIIFNTTTNKLNFFNGSSWQAITSS